MENSKGSVFKNNSHSNPETYVETQNLSSYTEETNRSPSRKHQSKMAQPEFYPPLPEHYPLFYTPSWISMNYMYLDMLKQLSFASERSSSFPQMGINNWNELERKNKSKSVKKNKMTSSGKKKINNEDSTDEEVEEEETSLAKLCPCCSENLKCSCCGHKMKKTQTSFARGKVSHKLCQHTSAPNPYCVNVDFPRACCHCLHQKPPQPLCCASSITCKNMVQSPIEIPVQDTPKKGKKYRKSKKSSNVVETHSESNDSNTEEDFKGKSPGRSSGEKKLTNRLDGNDDLNKSDCEDAYGLMPSFVGGTGDKGAESKVKTAEKIYPFQNTAYFLPLSSLSSK